MESPINPIYTESYIKNNVIYNPNFHPFISEILGIYRVGEYRGKVGIKKITNNKLRNVVSFILDEMEKRELVEEDQYEYSKEKLKEFENEWMEIHRKYDEANDRYTLDSDTSRRKLFGTKPIVKDKSQK